MRHSLTVAPRYRAVFYSNAETALTKRIVHLDCLCDQLRGSRQGNAQDLDVDTLSAGTSGTKRDRDASHPAAACFRLERLPLHHKDPFDRILAAQALEEGVAILTADPQFAAYGVSTAW